MTETRLTVRDEQRPMMLSLAPRTLAEGFEFSKMLAASDLVPKDYRGKPANVLVAIQYGYELGLSPMAAVQSISVINGRPCLWGDALPALVRSHPQCVSFRESIEGDGDAMVAICRIQRKDDMTEQRFSVADARKAGLWGKAGPWAQYPRRMLQVRARAFACRDAFPDALHGLQVAEEVRDYQVINPRQSDQPASHHVAEDRPLPNADETAAQPLSDADRVADLIIAIGMAEDEKTLNRIAKNARGLHGEARDTVATAYRVRRDELRALIAEEAIDADIATVSVDADDLARDESDG